MKNVLYLRLKRKKLKSLLKVINKEKRKRKRKKRKLELENSVKYKKKLNPQKIIQEKGSVYKIKEKEA